MNDDKIVIDRDVFVAANFFLAADELKKEGLVSGGPDINKGLLLAIVKLGKSMGFDEPSKDEIKSIAYYMREGGKWEKESKADMAKAAIKKEKNGTV